MSLIRIALLACPNGFGHTRRLLCLSEQLIRRGFDVTLYASSKSFYKLHKSLDLTILPKFHHFNLPDFHNYWRTKDIYSLSLFPDVSSFDFVVTDNLVDVLKLRHDSILLASFLWHKAFDYTPLFKHDYYENLLQIYRPKIFASKIFATQSIRACSNLTLEKLYRTTSLNSGDSKSKNNILISTGKGGQIKPVLEKFIENKPNWAKIFEPHTVFLEPDLVKSQHLSNVIPASFNSRMFSSCRIALIRPGVGSITDCLSHNVLPLFFYEDSNTEMVHNASIMQNLGLGFDMKSFHNAYSRCTQFISDNQIYDRFTQNILLHDIFGDSQIPQSLSL